VRTDSLGSPTGEAVAFDIFIPVIPSRDGRDRSRNLVLAAELATGRGVGGLEYSGLNLGVPGVTAATPNAGSAIDSGIAGINSDGNIELVRYRAFRGHVQYTMPGGRWSLASGYAQVEGRNLDRFSATPAKAAAIAPKIQYGFAAAFYDPQPWLRLAGELSRTRDTYNDPSNRTAANTRAQLSVLFIF
ncbi:MAG: hypothetical protein PHF00_04530, partial [Elusimicrobia bacterium]|nr:hypothetical protein [Elusimicrobiota bacterium]